MKKNRNKGFTLIEIIISIAVLSVVSVVFLELFIKADSVQKKGRELDDKAFLISNLFEGLSATESLDSFMEVYEPSRIEIQGDNKVLIYHYTSKLQLTLSDAFYQVTLKFIPKESLTTGILYEVEGTAFSKEQTDPFSMKTNFYERRLP